MAEAPQIKTLSNFKSVLKGGGARPNLFEVTIPEFPSYVTKDGEMLKDLSFMCKAANLPASNVASIDVPFRGRTLKVAGDRTFDPWTLTIINDEDFVLRTAFEKWADKISNLFDATGVTNPTSYMTNALVKQLGRGKEAFSEKNAGNVTSVLRTYKFYDIWPSDISAIELSYDSGDTIEEFTVNFQVQYFTVGETDSSANGSFDETVEEESAATL